MKWSNEIKFDLIKHFFTLCGLYSVTGRSLRPMLRIMMHHRPGEGGSHKAPPSPRDGRNASTPMAGFTSWITSADGRNGKDRLQCKSPHFHICSPLPVMKGLRIMIKNFLKGILWICLNLKPMYCFGNLSSEYKNFLVIGFVSDRTFSSNV